MIADTNTGSPFVTAISADGSEITYGYTYDPDEPDKNQVRRQKYVGSIKEGKLAYGTLTYRRDHFSMFQGYWVPMSYEGEFEDNMPSGDGTVVYSYGKYVGKMKGGEPNGFGFMTVDSKVYKLTEKYKHYGNFRNGKAEGEGLRRYVDGRCVYMKKWGKNLSSKDFNIGIEIEGIFRESKDGGIPELYCFEYVDEAGITASGDDDGLHGEWVLREEYLRYAESKTLIETDLRKMMTFTFPSGNSGTHIHMSRSDITMKKDRKFLQYLDGYWITKGQDQIYSKYSPDHVRRDCRFAIDNVWYEHDICEKNMQMNLKPSFDPKYTDGLVHVEFRGFRNIENETHIGILKNFIKSLQNIFTEAYDDYTRRVPIDWEMKHLQTVNQYPSARRAMQALRARRAPPRPLIHAYSRLHVVVQITRSQRL